MKYRYIFVITLLLVVPISASAFKVGSIAKKNVMTEAGKLAGASCDVKQAYEYLQSKAVGHGWKITPGIKGNNGGLDPELACRLEKFFKTTGCGQIYSAVRDEVDTQRAIRQNGGKGVNRYGNSCHNYGLAVDVKGCSQYKDIATQLGLHFPYNQTHIQCTEHRAPRCNEQTLSCSGKVRTAQIKDITNRYKTNQYQNPYSSLLNKSSQQTSPVTTKGLWPLPSTPSTPSEPPAKVGMANISCKPNTITNTEKSLITWGCDSSATRSRGGTTRWESKFNTRGLLSGKGYAYPSKTTHYKIQCLTGDKVIGEDSCMVRVVSAEGSTLITRTSMELVASLPKVRWGTGTTLTWDSAGTGDCRLKSMGRILATGTSGTVETGRLFRSAAYVLECSTTRGTKSVKTEVGIR